MEMFELSGGFLGFFFQFDEFIQDTLLFQILPGIARSFDQHAEFAIAPILFCLLCKVSRLDSISFVFILFIVWQ